MLTITRTNSGHPDFVALVSLLDADLARRDGAEHYFYAPFNKVDTIKHVVLAYEDGLPAGCGALKENGDGTMEIKRMFVPETKRRKGVATGSHRPGGCNSCRIVVFYEYFCQHASPLHHTRDDSR